MSKHLKAIAVFVASCFAMLVPACVHAQDKPQTVPYGANPAAGHSLHVDDVNIYYEMYGSGGTPIVLLHGGLYGYIEEFGDLIGELSKHHRVIAIATRGHGKSDIGSMPFSYTLFARDAYAVIRHETSQKVDLLGFSDGAVTAYTLAAAHPELVRRLVAIGGPRKFADWTPAAQADFRKAKPSDVEKDSPQFVAGRKKLMPQPERWQEFVARLDAMELGPVYVSDAQIQSIQVPTLIIAGDHDPYNQTAKFVDCFSSCPRENWRSFLAVAMWCWTARDHTPSAPSTCFLIRRRSETVQHPSLRLERRLSCTRCAALQIAAWGGRRFTGWKGHT